MRKTIYVRDEDTDIWERAEKLAEEKTLSQIISEALKKFVREKETEVAVEKGFQRIEFRFNDSEKENFPRKVAFTARWIAPPDKPIQQHSLKGSLNPLQALQESDIHCYAVAITAKNNIVVYGWTCSFAPFSLAPPKNQKEWLAIYNDFRSAIADSRASYGASAALEKIGGVPVEELDI